MVGRKHLVGTARWVLDLEAEKNILAVERRKILSKQVSWGGIIAKRVNNLQVTYSKRHNNCTKQHALR